MTSLPAFEPFRAKSVDPIAPSTSPQRRKWLAEADHNLFRLRSDQVMIDLLTDSGTGAMSSAQWAAMMRGDESYAGSTSYFRLHDVLRRITGIEHMLPVHQGRVAERLLVEAIIGKSNAGEGMIVPSNAHFDTTRCMIESSGAETVNLLCDRIDAASDDARIAHQRSSRRKTGVGNQPPPSYAPATSRMPVPPHDASFFLGNIDLHKLDQFLGLNGHRVPFVMMTITCNSNGGQPVSLENVRSVRDICDRHGKMLFLDACRFAENAWFISRRETASESIASIVRRMFDLADGAVMSTRKDALCNVGGLLLMRDEHFYRKACNLCVLTEGFQMTYGTLPGRDLEAIAVGMQEALDETYLTARVEAVQSLATALAQAGISVIEPTGGHAVFIDAEDFCPHLKRTDNPAHALACAIYEHAGVRCTRIGSVLKNHRGQPMELVRLAIPRRRYSQAQMEYVANAIVELRANAHTISGMVTTLPTRVVIEPSAEPAFQAA